ncbi:hypothetical protein M9458_030287, partial [Cirrhinus mrigala]
VVLAYMKELGLRLNAKKTVLFPLQRISYLGMVHIFLLLGLSHPRGSQETASNVIPFVLLYMRPLQWWLKTKGFSLRGNLLRMITVHHIPRCLRSACQPCRELSPQSLPPGNVTVLGSSPSHAG